METCHCATGHVLLCKPPHIALGDLFIYFFQPLCRLWSEAVFVKWFSGGSPLDSCRRQQENGCPLAEPAGAEGTTLGTSLWIHSLSFFSFVCVCVGGLCEFEGHSFFPSLFVLVSMRCSVGFCFFGRIQLEKTIFSCFMNVTLGSLLVFC